MTADLVSLAERFASEKHSRQLRKDRVTPYITHPAAVVETLVSLNIDDPVILASAWLHDTLEDTDTTIGEISSLFGEEVAGIVEILTRDCSRVEYSRRIQNACYEAKIVKLADIEHNLRTLHHLDPGSIERKIRECEEVYLLIAEEICRPLYNMIKNHVDSYRNSSGSIRNLLADCGQS